MTEETNEKEVGEMSDAAVLDRIIELGFDGDWELYKRFCEKLREGLPENTGVALRGSVVTNEQL